MKLFNKLNLASVGLVAYAMSALNAMAQSLPTPAPTPTTPAPIAGGTGIIVFVNQIATWISFLFWALAVIFIFYAAFLYLTAGGEEEKVKKANHQLIYAVIAIVVALFAYGLPLFVKNILGNQ